MNLFIGIVLFYVFGYALALYSLIWYETNIDNSDLVVESLWLAIKLSFLSWIMVFLTLYDVLLNYINKNGNKVLIKKVKEE